MSISFCNSDISVIIPCSAAYCKTESCSCFLGVEQAPFDLLILTPFSQIVPVFLITNYFVHRFSPYNDYYSEINKVSVQDIRHIILSRDQAKSAKLISNLLPAI